ncbi:MAG: VanZ family protein [Chitinophagaceae bacterium]|nr:VanZ family protein [Chitinophagaceae bacterium]
MLRHKLFRLKNKKLILAAAIIYFIITIILLTIPGSDLPKNDWLDKIWFDKWVHIGLFAIWVWLWCLYANSTASASSLKKIFIYITITGICYGVIMEFVQRYWIPHRSFDTGDIIADAVGCLLAFFYCSGRYIKK